MRTQSTKLMLESFKKFFRALMGQVVKVKLTTCCTLFLYQMQFLFFTRAWDKNKMNIRIDKAPTEYDYLNSKWNIFSESVHWNLKQNIVPFFLLFYIQHHYKKLNNRAQSHKRPKSRRTFFFFFQIELKRSLFYFLLNDSNKS